MILREQKQINQAAYLHLARSINHTYPNDRFVAIAGGMIVADAATFDELDAALTTLGQDSDEVLVVQAGHVYPESAVIFI